MGGQRPAKIASRSARARSCCPEIPAERRHSERARRIEVSRRACVVSALMNVWGASEIRMGPGSFPGMSFTAAYRLLHDRIRALPSSRRLASGPQTAW